MPYIGINSYISNFAGHMGFAYHTVNSFKAASAAREYFLAAVYLHIPLLIGSFRIPRLI